MKQQIFKEMYDDIQLNREQRSRIWKHLEAEESLEKTKSVKVGNKWGRPAIAAVCACLILVISVPSVLAAKSTVLDNIVHGFNLFSTPGFGGKERTLTEEQTDVYENYGNALNEEITLPHGNIKLEAMINDKHFVFLPFSVDIGEGAGAAGEDIRNTPFFKHTLNILTDDWCCYLEDSTDIPMGIYTSLDPVIQEDGRSLSGAFLLNDTERNLKQGQVIRFRQQKETEQKPGKTICRLTLNTPVNSKKMPADTLLKQMPEGAVIDSITISPLSLNVKGKNLAVGKLFDATVELKDGRIVKPVATGNSAAYDQTLEGNEDYNENCSVMILWSEPINIDEVKAIHCPEHP